MFIYSLILGILLKMDIKIIEKEEFKNLHGHVLYKYGFDKALSKFRVNKVLYRQIMTLNFEKEKIKKGSQLPKKFTKRYLLKVKFDNPKENYRAEYGYIRLRSVQSDANSAKTRPKRQLLLIPIGEVVELVPEEDTQKIINEKIQVGLDEIDEMYKKANNPKINVYWRKIIYYSIGYTQDQILEILKGTKFEVSSKRQLERITGRVIGIRHWLKLTE